MDLIEHRRCPLTSSCMYIAGVACHTNSKYSTLIFTKLCDIYHPKIEVGLQAVLGITNYKVLGRTDHKVLESTDHEVLGITRHKLVRVAVYKVLEIMTCRSRNLSP